MIEEGKEKECERVEEGETERGREERRAGTGFACAGREREREREKFHYSIRPDQSWVFGSAAPGPIVATPSLSTTRYYY